MRRSDLKPLFRPFEIGALAAPTAGERVLFLGAEPGMVQPEDFAATITCVQGFRPHFLALARERRTVSPVAEGEGYDAALVLASRHRAENETRLAEAILRVRAGGLVVMAGGREDGVAALRERLEKNRDSLREALRGQSPRPPTVVRHNGGVALPSEPPERQYHFLKAPVPLGGHLSKSHGVVFWLTRTPEAEAFAAQAIEWHGGRPLTAGRFRTAPSSFSHDRIDAGSKLLADCLPADLKGAVADFCAGWGYLAAEVVRRCPGVARIDLYEADYDSLEAAKRNLEGFAAARFFWQDLAAEPVAERYDAIVMNPPFHRGRAAEPGIGRDMIGAAASALRKGGRLFMVANRELPYETTLGQLFAQWRETAREGGFKTFVATR